MIQGFVQQLANLPVSGAGGKLHRCGRAAAMAGLPARCLGPDTYLYLPLKAPLIRL
jgi:hypothetical protein